MTPLTPSDEMPDLYEAYGVAAAELSSPTLIAGRRSFHTDDEPRIIDDIVSKLALTGTERLLEIGCGVGTLLNGLSRHVAEAVGLDHPSCIRKYRAMGVPRNIELIEGRWPETAVIGSFDRVLAYSVLQCLPDADSARLFIDSCVPILRSGGALLLGDIPNCDMMRRLQQSTFGAAVQERYRDQQSRCGEDVQTVMRDRIFARARQHAPFMGDDFILGLLRRLREMGINAFVLPQPERLPFCYSREDVVAWKQR